MVAPALNDYEYQYEDDGVLLNQADAGVTAVLPWIDVDTVEGLDSPEFRSATHDHEGVDGGYIDADFMQMRTIVVEGTLYADPDDPDSVCDLLKENYRPASTERPFYFKHPNMGVRVVYGKSLGARYKIDSLRRHGRTPIMLTVVCPTPYIYSADDIVGSGTLGGADPGHGFDHGFDLTFGGTGGFDGTVELFNEGNHEAYPMLTIFGPVDNPTLTSQGKTLAFNISLGPSDWLTIDTQKHAITLNGISSRRNSLIAGSQWFTVPKRSSAEIVMAGSVPTSQGIFTATVIGSTSTLEGADADAGDIAPGDKFLLYDSVNALKQVEVFQIQSLSSSAGNTTVQFSPSAAVATAVGDQIRTGVATFTASIKSTWY